MSFSRIAGELLDQELRPALLYLGTGQSEPVGKKDRAAFPRVTL